KVAALTPVLQTQGGSERADGRWSHARSGEQDGGHGIEGREEGGRHGHAHRQDGGRARSEGRAPGGRGGRQARAADPEEGRRASSGHREEGGSPRAGGGGEGRPLRRGRGSAPALTGAGLHALAAAADRGGGEADAPVGEAGDQVVDDEGVREEGHDEVA